MFESEIDQQVHYGNLLAVYGMFLTEKQQEYMELYFQEDYSLAEIAEKFAVSRAAIHKQIQVSCKKIDDLETALHAMYLQQTFLPTLEDALNSNNIKEAKNLVKEIKNKLERSV